MYCCCEKIKPNLGHMDIVISDIEQNTKNNEIYSNKLVSKNSNQNIMNNLNYNNEKNKNIINKNDTQNTILSFGSHKKFLNKFNKNNINNTNICLNNYNKSKNEYKASNKSIINSTRNIFDQGKINLNNTKSENYWFNSFSNNNNGSIIVEENIKNHQKESSNMINNNYYKKLSFFSLMTDNFSCREETNDFNNIIFMLNNRNITEEEILRTKKLKITGNPIDFFYGKEIMINAAGVFSEIIINNINNSNINSTKLKENNNINKVNDIQCKTIKNEKKGITFFGQNNINNNIKNIVLINYNREKFSDYNNEDIFFYIYYLRETKKYYLKPNINSIMFLKLKPKTAYKIRQGEILSFGNAILLLKRNKSGFNNYLSIDYNQENFLFKDEEYINTNKCIKIGRDKNCDIVIENRKTISRVNVIIKYNSRNEEWEIYDGDENYKESLNGVRILLRKQYEINEECDIEFLGQRFIIQLLSDDKINVC